MKEAVLKTLSKYLEIFPEEKKRQEQLTNYLQCHQEEEITNKNNFDGHITAGGFIYAVEDRKLVLLHHRDLNMLLYPGGHSESTDSNPLETAKREIMEETGLTQLEEFQICEDPLVPIDIDTHVIEYNQRLNLPEHYHFDYRYLFFIHKIADITIDTKESKSYQWIDLEQLATHSSYAKVLEKLRKYCEER